MEDKEKANKYFEELQKCVGQEVKVVDTDGREHEGICKAINYNYLNVVIMSDEEKTIIKNISTIRRKRDLSWDKKKEKKEAEKK